jgi:uncharacterized membrane protein YkvA (DUF1232 family)
MSIISKITDWVTTPYTIYLALKDPTISRSEKLRSVIGLVLIFAYIISPLDIIPDFIPMSGWLDDLVVVPLGLAIMRKIIPNINVLERRDRARSNVRRILLLTMLSLVIAVSLGVIWLGLLIYIIVRLTSG